MSTKNISSYHNSKSRRESYKRHERSIENKERRVEKDRKEIASLKKERKVKSDIKSDKKKKQNDLPISLTASFSDSNDIGLRVPVKYSLFGTMKKESRKLIENLLIKNYDYITSFIPEIKYIKSDKNEEKVKYLFEKCKYGKKSKLNLSSYDKFMKNTNPPIWVSKDKYGDYYFNFNLSHFINQYRCDKILYNHDLLNYIELRTHFYENIDTRKYKFKNANVNKDGVRAEFFNMSIPFHIIKITNNMSITNSGTKNIPCIYRFYFKTGKLTMGDITGSNVFHIKNKNETHFQKLIENKPSSALLYSIPNILRYSKNKQ